MNLKHISLLSEDEKGWRVRDARDNSSFLVAKQGLGEGTKRAIVQHFAKGGEVEAGADSGGLTEMTRAGIRKLDLLRQQNPELLKDPSYMDAIRGFDMQRMGLQGVAPESSQDSGEGVQEMPRMGGLTDITRAGVQQLQLQAKKNPELLKDRSWMDALTGFDMQRMGLQGVAPKSLDNNLSPQGADPLAALRAQSQQLQGAGPMTPALDAMPVPTEVSPRVANILSTHQPSPTPAPPAQLPSPMPSPEAAQPGGPSASMGLRPPGTSAFDKEIASNTGAMAKAEQERANVAAKQAEESLRLQQAVAQKRDTLGQQWEERWRQNQAKADQLQADIASSKVDPNRFWSSRTTGQRIAATIGLILGGIGQAFGGGANPALQLIHSAMDRDLEAQKADVGKKQNLLSSYMQQGHNIQEAGRLAKADQMDALAGQLQMVATKYQGPQAQANAESTIAALKQGAAKDRQQVHQQAFKNSIDMLEAQAKLAAATGTKPAPNVPAKEAADIGGFRSAAEQVDSLVKLRGEKVGALSGATQYIPGTDAAQYRDAQKLAAQAVGVILEGGKLSDRDKPFYESLMPTAGDSEERAKAKVENIKTMLARKAAANAEALGAAGYNTQGLQTLAKPPVERVRVVGPNGERGTMDVRELSQHPDWKQAQ